MRPRRSALEVSALVAMGDRGTLAVHGLSLAVKRGEILGIAGVSGNGQRELVEAIVGQRPRVAGTVKVVGQPYFGRRAENHVSRLRSLPEEPLAQRLRRRPERGREHGPARLRRGTAAPAHPARPRLAALRAWRARAREWIAAYGIKTRGENAPIASLSGGNVQRAVLARELAGEINVLIAANPVFGLDFAAVREIHARIVQCARAAARCC